MGWSGGTWGRCPHTVFFSCGGAPPPPKEPLKTKKNLVFFKIKLAFTKQSTKIVKETNHIMYKELISNFRVLDSKFWHTSTEISHPMYGKKEITFLCERYSLDLDKTLYVSSSNMKAVEFQMI